MAGLALGSGDVTVLEMANAYATLASGGKHAEPVFVRKILGPDDSTIHKANLEEKQVIAPTVIYQITSLMQSVVERGTAVGVKSLERPIAGKTGTTNEARNAWFIAGIRAGIQRQARYSFASLKSSRSSTA